MTFAVNASGNNQRDVTANWRWWHECRPCFTSRDISAVFKVLSDCNALVVGLEKVTIFTKSLLHAVIEFGEIFTNIWSRFFVIATVDGILDEFHRHFQHKMIGRWFHRVFVEIFDDVFIDFTVDNCFGVVDEAVSLANVILDRVFNLKAPALGFNVELFGQTAAFFN